MRGAVRHRRAVTLFWAAFDQQGITILLWAEDFTDRSVNLWFWSGEIPAVWFLSLNPLMIFVLTPFLVRLWTDAGAPAARAARRCARWRSAALCLTAAYLVMAVAAKRGRQGEPALAGRLFRHRHARRTLPRADRARARGHDGARAHALDADGRVVRRDAARRHPRPAISAASGAACRRPRSSC